LALSRMDELGAERTREVEDVIAGLEERAGDLAKEGRFAEAEALVRDYSGRLADETSGWRQRAGENFRGLAAEAGRRAASTRAAEEAARKDRAEKAVQLLDTAADTLIKEGVGPARELVEKSISEQGLDNVTSVCDTLHLLRKMESVDGQLMKTFRPGTVTIALDDGSRALRVLSATNGQIRCEEQVRKNSYVVTMPVTIELGLLSVGEMVGRLGADNQEAVIFMKVIHALKNRAYGAASELLSKTSSALSPALKQKVAELSAADEKNSAEQALAKLLRSCGVNVPDQYDAAVWMDALSRAKITIDQKAVEARTEAYRKEHGGSDFGRKVEGLLAELVSKVKADAVGAVAAAMAQIDEEAVRKMLLKHNPELAREDIAIEKSGKYPGYCLRVRSERLTSIGALRTCGSTITELDVSGSRVKDLAGISGTRLRSIDISDTKVTTLPVLSSLPLERLVMRNNTIADLAPLAKTRLKELDLSGVKVSDLRAIQNLPIEFLNLNDTGLKDRELGLLKNMPLKSLNLRNCLVTSIAPLQKLPLQVLDMSGCAAVRDFTPLSAMQLRSLTIDDTGIADLSVLQKMNLESLRVAGTGVRDLAPLIGMALARLDISRTRVSSLAPLKGMPLTDLNLSGATVSDLSPLAGMALNRFACAGVHPASWKPIAGMPIADLTVTIPEGGQPPEFVKTLQNLRVLNGRPVKRKVVKPANS
ncbi:MAG: leucine-rich repeat domain-containing protein, partial [bacterium]